MIIYKIFRATEWEELKSNGSTKGAPIDVTDGFVHFSTGKQIAETCARYFEGEDGLVLLALDGDDLGTHLKWEPSRDGALFPHLYRPLTLADLMYQTDLPRGFDGRHIFPDGVL